NSPMVASHNDQEQLARAAARIAVRRERPPDAFHPRDQEPRALSLLRVSQPYLRGITTPPPSAIVRVPAAEIESAVASPLKAHLPSVPGPAGTENVAEQNMIASFVSRIEIHKNELAVWLKVSLPDAANLDPACVERHFAVNSFKSATKEST